MSVSSFTNPAPDEILTFLKGVKRIAVIGLSPQSGRPSHQAARVLQRHGFEIVPVRPGVAEILGEQAYPALDQVPGRIDLVDVFRAAEHVPAIVDQALALGIPGIWLQDGVIAPAAAQRAASGGMFVVMDDCLGRFLHRHGRPAPD
jgi:predicted CoA-binding protein